MLFKVRLFNLRLFKLPLFKLAWRSFLHRRKTMSLIVVSLFISFIMLLSLQLLKTELKRSFYSGVSGTDLIVGARGSSLNLLLNSVFHLGDAIQPMDWRSFNKLRQDRSVAWAIPIALGDSHRGSRVVGTSTDFFSHYRYADGRNLALEKGRAFTAVDSYSKDAFEVVLGAGIARELNYQLGDTIVVSHGLAAVSFKQHQQNPLRVVGVLATTGTSVDQGLYVDISVLELLHLTGEYSVGAKLPNPDKISSVLVGLKSKLSTFSLQRKINEFRGEPLQAILPGVTLSELWRLLEQVERILWAMAVLLMLSSLMAMVSVLLASMQERQRELAIIRVLGGGFFTLTSLLLIEVFIVVLLSSVLALASTQILLSLTESLWLSYLGFPLSGSVFSQESLILIATFTAASLLAALIPAVLASRRSLASGLTLRH